MPDTASSAGVVRALDFTPDDVVPARADWLALFGTGAEMTPFAVEGAGGVPEGALGQIAGVTTGSVVVNADTGQPYVALADGRLARLSPLADAVYATRENAAERIVVPADALSQVEDATDGIPIPESWPTAIGEPVSPDLAPCAELDVEAFAAVLVPGQAPDASGRVTVSPGTGALALFTASPSSPEGPVRFIDENGLAYAIEGGPSGPREDALLRLFPTGGADQVVPIRVPYAWGDLVPSGPTLSIDRAAMSQTEVPVADGGEEATP
ncbi:type VII secretion protein EccB [Serinibacter arcticus]|uniref:type VII secretion protein EccB n=1 Tax=Serinibacter arcticus TaxID=1655435 RepID=UPI0018EE5636